MSGPDVGGAEERSCGHALPDPLENAHLGCSRYKCSKRVVACVVYVGQGLRDQACWRINPTCRKHLKLTEQTARKARDVDHPGVFRHRPRMAKILTWIHDDGRCAVECVSVTAHEEP